VVHQLKGYHITIKTSMLTKCYAVSMKGTFLTRGATGGFSRSILFCGISNFVPATLA